MELEELHKSVNEKIIEYENAKKNKKAYATLGLEIEKLRQQIKVKMALGNEKVLSLLSNILGREDFDGDPQGLHPFIDKVNIIKLAITHAEDVKLAVAIVRSRLKGKAREVVINSKSLDDIIEVLQKKCKGKSSWQIATTLEGLKVQSKEQYIKDINDLAEKLKISYINEGSSQEIAKQYAIQNVTKNVRKNFISNPVMVSAMSGEFSDLSEVIHRFENISIEREAHILAIKKFKTRDKNNFHKNGYNKSKYYKQGKSNYNPNYNQNKHNNLHSSKNKVRQIKTEEKESLTEN